MKFYDFVIAGAGCSGLSLAVELAKAGVKKSILLIDTNIHPNQDKTWCFWEKPELMTYPFPVTQWQNLSFSSKNYEKNESITPFNYFGIKSSDYYEYCYEVISKEKNIDLVEASITKIYGVKDGACLETKEQTYFSPFIFNSTSVGCSVSFNNDKLKQHFRGWLIKTTRPSFDKHTATFMDFRTPQHNEVRFFYVLPYSDTEALIEYTIFSTSLLEESAYNENIKNYIDNTLDISDYQIVAYEKGVIPMYHIIPNLSHPNIIPIGIAGGSLKPSTGFAFSLIQQKTKEIAEAIASVRKIEYNSKLNNRFSFYDKVLLHLLEKGEFNKSELFISLFKENKIAEILLFLSEKTSLQEEIRLFTSLPIKTFIKAVIDLYNPFGDYKKDYSPLYQTSR